MTVLYEQRWDSGDYFAFSSPKKKIKLEGGGENSYPHFLPGFHARTRAKAGRERARDEADQWQSTGPGLGRAAGPSLLSSPSPVPNPLPLIPSPAGPARQGRPALHSPPHRPHRGRLGPDSRAGGGAGVPCRRILPRGWRRGGGDGDRGMED